MINKIYNENCIDTMLKMKPKSVNAVITSPPYNTSRKGSSLDYNSSSIRYDEYDDCKSDKEYIEWTIDIFKHYDLVLKENGIVVYNISYGSENTYLMWLVIAEIINKTNFTTADCIVWKKQSAVPNNVSPNKLTRICEYVFIFCRKTEINTFQCNKTISSKRKTGQLSYNNQFNFIEAKNNDGSTDIHKATYSSELVRKLIKIYVKENELVYDSFMGTGTTAIACIKEKVNYIGSEISKRYVDLSNERIDILNAQQTLF